MFPFICVQLKAEHHAPQGEHARKFALIRQMDNHAIVRQFLHEDELAPVETRFGAQQLRYADDHPAQKLLEREVSRGHSRIVDKMLRTDALLDANGSNECSLLSLLGHLSDAYANRVMDVLLGHGAALDHQAFADGHSSYWTPLWQAVHDDKLPHVKRLLARGARCDLPCPPPSGSQNFNIMHLAASCGLIEMIAFLLDQPQCPPVNPDEIKFQLRAREDRFLLPSYQPSHAGVPLPLLHTIAAGASVEDPALASRLLAWLIETGEQWEERDAQGHTALEVARLTGSGYLAVFEERNTQSQATLLQQRTPPASRPGRRPRM